MNEDLLVKKFIEPRRGWTDTCNAEAFLKQLVETVDATVETGVTDEEKLAKDSYTLHLSKGGKLTSLGVSFEELVNCNSTQLQVAAESQRKLAGRIRKKLAVIDKTHRRLGFLE